MSAFPFVQTQLDEHTLAFFSVEIDSSKINDENAHLTMNETLLK